MRLKVEIARHLGGIVQQNFVHRDGIGAQVIGASQNHHLGIVLAQAVHNSWAVGIHHDLVYFLAGQECIQDMMEKRFACQGPVVFSGDAH